MTLQDEIEAGRSTVKADAYAMPIGQGGNHRDDGRYFQSDSELRDAEELFGGMGSEKLAVADQVDGADLGWS
ncbi:MAG TPA: hypothetical protein VK545_12725 [Streptomyces sp.]|nr:hypothetical protein [Streptomyces sp.]